MEQSDLCDRRHCFNEYKLHIRMSPVIALLIILSLRSKPRINYRRSIQRSWCRKKVSNGTIIILIGEFRRVKDTFLVKFLSHRLYELSKYLSKFH